ncbi:MAG TPA: hypothetical protein VEW42_06580 [Candidatus Eisenbacteria bacterium]|nr:hypothetical protein [Candidatus Eisenbacteria bacterium]
MSKHIPVYIQQGERLVQLRLDAEDTRIIGQPVDKRIQTRILASPRTIRAGIHMIPGLQWYEIERAGQEVLHIDVTKDMSHVSTGGRRALFTKVRNEVERQIPDRPLRLIVR